jgi:hypothetical protein
VASQLIEDVTAHAQSDSLEDARERYAQTVLTFRRTYVQFIILSTGFTILTV